MMFKTNLVLLFLLVVIGAKAQSYVYDEEGTAYLLHGIACTDILSLSDSSFCEAQNTYGIGGEVFIKDIPYTIEELDLGYDVFINHKLHLIIRKEAMKGQTNLLIYQSNKLFVVLKKELLYAKQKGKWRKLYKISGETLTNCHQNGRATAIDAFASPYEFTGKVKLED